MILACPQGSFDTHLTLSHSPNRRKMNYDEQQYLSRIGRKLALSLLLSTFETGRVSIGPICAVKFRILLGRSAREVNVELLRKISGKQRTSTRAVLNRHKHKPGFAASIIWISSILSPVKGRYYVLSWFSYLSKLPLLWRSQTSSKEN